MPKSTDKVIHRSPSVPAAAPATASVPRRPENPQNAELRPPNRRYHAAKQAKWDAAECRWSEGIASSFYRLTNGMPMIPLKVIITRTPLRISIGGGGTDLPSYYRRFGGFVISAAINKHIYVGINETFSGGYFLKYSALEHALTLDDIRHPLIREVLRMHDVRPPIEVVSMAAVPAGTGLGSSGAFTVGLLRAVHALSESMSTRLSWPRRPVRSRSTFCGSRSVNRTSTSRLLAAWLASSSPKTGMSRSRRSTSAKV